MFKNLRIDILNWLAAGRIVLEKDKPQEYKSMSTYAITGGNGISLNPGYVAQTPTTNNQTITIKVTPANGGNIVSVQSNDYAQGELHIIPDDTDFDRELGKIITMSKLKA